MPFVVKVLHYIDSFLTKNLNQQKEKKRLKKEKCRLWLSFFIFFLLIIWQSATLIRLLPYVIYMYADADHADDMTKL